MICKGYDDVMELDDGELVELHDVRGATLRVTHGTLWITQDRDVRDVVLRTGDVWTVERDGLTLAEAQGTATFCLLGGSARRVGSRRTRSTYRERLAAWVAGLAQRRFSARRFVPYF